MSEVRRALLVLAVTASTVFGAPPAPADAQDWRETTISRRLDGAAPVRTEVTYGAGAMTLRATDEPVLYRMRIRYDGDVFTPVADFSGSRLKVGVEGTGSGIRVGRDASGGSMDLELARGVPMDLVLQFGAVKADVDLGGLALTGLELATGASESRIEVSAPNPSRLGTAQFKVGAADFSLSGVGNLSADRIEVQTGVGQVRLALDGVWRHDAEVSVEMGLGSLRLSIPEGLGVRVRKDSFLTSFDPEGLVKRGDAYYSLDWETAERKVTIDLNAAFGSVQVLWIR